MSNLKTDLRNFNKGGYSPGSSFKWALWFIFSSCCVRSYQPFYFLRAGMLRLFGAKIGERVVLKPGLIVKFPWFLEIGNDVWLGEKVWLENQGAIKIGNNVCISQGAVFMTGNHNYKKTTFDLMVQGITLEEGVWIGACAVVCPGVTCKSHSILTAGSVAADNLEAYSIYQGNPAVKIKDRILSE